MYSQQLQWCQKSSTTDTQARFFFFLSKSQYSGQVSLVSTRSPFSLLSLSVSRELALYGFLQPVLRFVIDAVRLACCTACASQMPCVLTLLLCLLCEYTPHRVCGTGARATIGSS